MQNMPLTGKSRCQSSIETESISITRSMVPVRLFLLTHGYSSTAEMWQGQIAALSKHHKLVLWDMRGHGRSDYPDDAAAYSEAADVADMAALLDEVGAETAIVGGLSLGGYMSLAFYRAHPERVRALLIIDTGPGFKKDEARDAWNRRALETGDRFEREGLAGLQLASRERSSVTHRDASGLARAARGMLTQRDARVIESLARDKSAGAGRGRRRRHAVPRRFRLHGGKNSRRAKVVIPAAGHAVNIDQPQAFIDAVLPFLDSLEAKHGCKRAKPTVRASVMRTWPLSPCAVAGAGARQRAATPAVRRPLPAAVHRDALEQYAAGLRHGRRRCRSRARHAAQLHQRPSWRRSLSRVPQLRRQRIVHQEGPPVSAVSQRQAGGLEGRLGPQLDVAIATLPRIFAPSTSCNPQTNG